MASAKRGIEISPQKVTEEMNEISAYAQEYLLEINKVLSKVPRQLLLLFKTNDCLRSIDSTLKAPINSFLLTSRYCTLAIQKDRLSRHPGFRTKIQNFVESLKMEYRIWVISIFKSIQGILGSFFSWTIMN
jgi:aarF domain-containing kinase